MQGRNFSCPVPSTRRVFHAEPGATTEAAAPSPHMGTISPFFSNVQTYTGSEGNQIITLKLPASHRGFVFVVAGSVAIGKSVLNEGAMGWIESSAGGDSKSEAQLLVQAVGKRPEKSRGSAFFGHPEERVRKPFTVAHETFLPVFARVIVCTGAPFNEPVVGRGPFVASNSAELSRFIQDYQQVLVHHARRTRTVR